MLHDGRAIRVAVVGGSRIPFCRSHSVYKNCTNLDMMTAALEGGEMPDWDGDSYQDTLGPHYS